METLPQVAKPAVISFRCDAEFKKSVDKALIDRGMTLQVAGTQALAQFLSISVPVKTKVA